MTTAQDPVSVRVKAGLYEFTFAFAPDELDEATARARRCGLTLDAFVHRKMLGPGPERQIGMADHKIRGLDEIGHGATPSKQHDW